MVQIRSIGLQISLGFALVLGMLLIYALFGLEAFEGKITQIMGMHGSEIAVEQLNHVERRIFNLSDELIRYGQQPHVQQALIQANVFPEDEVQEQGRARCTSMSQPCWQQMALAPLSLSLSRFFIPVYHHFRAEPVFISVMLMDRQGYPIAWAGDPIDRSLPHLQCHTQLAENRVFVSEPFLDQKTGHYLIRLTAALLDPQGHTVGSLCSLIPALHILRHAVSKLSVSNRGDFYLFDQSGRLLYADHPFRLLESFAHAQQFKLASQEQGFFWYQEHHKRTLYSYARRVKLNDGGNKYRFKGGGWVLIIGWPDDFISSPIWAFKQQQLWSLMLAALVAIAIALVITFMVTKRLAQVRRATHQLALGDYSQRIPQMYRDEVGQLAADFNHMATELEQAHQVLKLEVRQRRKTQEDLQAQTQALLRSNSYLERFAYSASHDLQEPLRSVSNYLRIIQRRYGERLDAEGESFVQHTLNASKRMQRMIEGLLLLSRVNTQGRDFKKLNTERLMQEVMDNLTVAIQEAGATITFDDLPEIEGDETQLADLFQNLLNNAMRYQHAQRAPIIQVHGEVDEQGIQLVFKDNGMGIESQYWEDIFTIFKRLNPLGQVQGSGIGLALCRQIMAHHNGTITVHSQPEQGSTFTLHFPPPGCLADRGGEV
ncbi:ATP-binding protein [Magnetococcus sp. PR-3]|uniref:ATP-binding protein n=1 Tax=Magnetococcus sp. PR-3 TaxID=3120355 RepID=UPI002FCE3521